MAIPGNIKDREYQKFTETASGDTAVRIVGDIATGSLLNGISYDFGSVAYPNTTTEVFTLKIGGSSGATVATVTLIYTDNSKENLSSFEVVTP